MERRETKRYDQPTFRIMRGNGKSVGIGSGGECKRTTEKQRERSVQRNRIVVKVMKHIANESMKYDSNNYTGCLSPYSPVVTTIIKQNTHNNNCDTDE